MMRLLVYLAVVPMLLVGCGPSSEENQAATDKAVQEAEAEYQRITDERAKRDAEMQQIVESLYGPEGLRDRLEGLCKTGTPEEVLTAIGAGADPEANKFPVSVTWALALAAEFNTNPEVIRVLIENGADAKTCFSGMSKTVLMIAAESNTNPEVVRVLLEAGADIEVRSRYGKRTAYDYAKENAAFRGSDVLELLKP